MRSSAVMVPWVLLLGVACGARGSHGGDSEDYDDSPNELVLCDSDADCSEGDVCVDGQCAASDYPDDPEPQPNPTAPSATTESAPTVPVPTTTSTDGSTQPAPTPDVGGVWYGYVEANQLGTSDLLRLEIDTSSCNPTATLTIGEGEPPPPATDGSVGYPEGTSDPFGYGSYTWYEGFPYTAHDLTISDKRIQLTVERGELWGGWCELQTSYEWGEDWYGCLPNWGGSWSEGGCFQVSPEGETVERDCGQMNLCSGAGGVCSCNASGCGEGQVERGLLDVAIEDDHLEGTFSARGSVRFYREL